MRAKPSCTLILLGLMLSHTVPRRAEAAAWVTNGPLLTSRWFHTATLLPDGKVLLTGGIHDASGLATNGAEIYDPVQGKCIATGGMTTNRMEHTAILLPNGKVLISRWFHTATLLPDGKVLLTGGIHDASGL